MKKSVFILGILFFSNCILSSHGGSPAPPWEKENVSFPMMNQEIRHSMQESERQVEMKNKQLANSASERVNKSQWETYKNIKQKIQERLRRVDFALQAIPTGVVITRKSKEIKATQERIVREIRTAPYAVSVALTRQIQFVDDLQMTTRLLIGIVASYGAMNQMERAERKILLDYALAEVDRLLMDSEHTLMLVLSLKEKIRWKKNILRYYVNRDKELVTDIIKDVKNIGL